MAVLARAWLEVHDPACEWLFQLPGETRPTSSSFRGWFDDAMSFLGVSAPLGFTYQPHSIRSGAASAHSAIGVPLHIVTWIGGWQRGSLVVQRDYIDPTVLPSPSAYRLYGWLLARQFEADAGVVQRFVALPDPLDEC